MIVYKRGFSKRGFNDLGQVHGQDQDQGQGQDQIKLQQRSPLQQQMVLALTLVLVLTLDLAQITKSPSAKYPSVFWLKPFWLKAFRLKRRQAVEYLIPSALSKWLRPFLVRLDPGCLVKLTAL